MKESYKVRSERRGKAESREREVEEWKRSKEEKKYCKGQKGEKRECREGKGESQSPTLGAQFLVDRPQQTDSRPRIKKNRREKEGHCSVREESKEIEKVEAREEEE